MAVQTSTQTKTGHDSRKISFDSETVNLIKKTVAQDANETELQLFLYYAEKTGLDPLARQIYLMKRNIRRPDGKYETKMTIQTSIDGFRLIAERSGQYAGQSEPEFTYGADKNMPQKCSITIYKFSPNGERYPASVGVAYWNEYCPPAGQDFMWRKMPHTMLAKTAEALGLRRAFPLELSGLYTDEEMDQADNTNQTIDNQQNKKIKDMRERAEKWLNTVPQKIIQILSNNDNQQFDRQRKELMNQLEAAKKAVTQYPDLIEKIDSCINDVKEDLFTDSEDKNYEERLEIKEEILEEVKKAKTTPRQKQKSK